MGGGVTGTAVSSREEEGHMATCVTGVTAFPIPLRPRRRGLRGEIRGMTEMSAVERRGIFRAGEKNEKKRENTSAVLRSFSLKSLLPTRRAALDDDKHTHTGRQAGSAQRD